jgi:hypothetical protein
MADEYYAEVYLRGCGELVQQGMIVDDSDPAVVIVTVYALKPGA